MPLLIASDGLHAHDLRVQPHSQLERVDSRSEVPQNLCARGVHVRFKGPAGVECGETALTLHAIRNPFNALPLVHQSHSPRKVGDVVLLFCVL